LIHGRPDLLHLLVVALLEGARDDADVTALLDQPHALHPGLPQPRAGDGPGEAAADDGDGDLVAARLALGRVVDETGELALRCDVLVGAVGAQPLGALERVLLP
jgi:hypothetical protein